MQKGIYNYFLNGEPTGVIETFDVEILPDGSKKTVSIRDAKPFKTTITVETIEKNNKFQSSKIVYQKDENKIEADYKFADNSFQIRRKLNNEIIQNEMLDFPKDAVFFPLMRCFQGNIIMQLAENQDFTIVIVPDIQPSTDFNNLLKPTFDERTTKLIRKDNNRFIYSYLSKHYDDNSEFHINENCLLIYYKFVQNESQTWEIKL